MKLPGNQTDPHVDRSSVLAVQLIGRFQTGNVVRFTLPQPDPSHLGWL